MSTEEKLVKADCDCNFYSSEVLNAVRAKERA
ncbi:hypothetical protein SRA_02211 [Streptococcus ratti FA-1 = DSM 20564]|uniref:Uncharacterized protein n=1 Tax=Streptococcus ratti FA-1 = DSM 20564 TaxID=699248 RepID=A0ABP2QWQ9_STRRT|nr:hypothetical protein SRA_02211 [Streptococcus ratti FA-1 = DSM 20564]